MLHLNVGHRLRDNLFEALRSSHRIKVKAHILDADEEPVSHLQWHYGATHLVSGSVQLDTTQDVDRSLELELLDPRGRLLFSPDTPADGGAWAEYMIAVEYCVLVPHHNLFPRSDLYPSPKHFPGDTALAESGTWVDIPVFQGPITHYESSSGGVVSLEGQGKESLSLAPRYAGKGYTLPKGLHIDNAIKRVLQEIGETRFALPDLPYKLKHHRSVHPQEEPWRIVAIGAEDSNGKHVSPLIKRTGRHPHHLFYDARGKVRAARLNKQSVQTFDERWLLSEPTVDYEGLEFINRVVVRGIKPKGKGKHRISAEVVLPRQNPLSPHNLARAGKPAYRTHYEDTDLDTQRKCRDRALHILAHQSVIGLDATFDCLPNPMIEPLDTVRVQTDTLHIEFPVRQATFPLTADAPMTIGETKRISPRPRIKGGKSHGAAGPPGRHGAGAARGRSGGGAGRGGNRGGGRGRQGQRHK